MADGIWIPPKGLGSKSELLLETTIIPSLREGRWRHMFLDLLQIGEVFGQIAGGVVVLRNVPLARQFHKLNPGQPQILGASAEEIRRSSKSGKTAASRASRRGLSLALSSTGPSGSECPLQSSRQSQRTGA